MTNKPNTRSLLWSILPLLFKVLLIFVALATPLLAVWVSSSLAAYSNGSIWISLLAGLALFPLLPLAWDLFGSWRRKKKNIDTPRVLTFGDRLFLRTLFLSSLFLGVLLWAQPKTAFQAISTRGDWMLDGQSAPWAEKTRGAIFWVANRLEWLYNADNDNPFRDVNPKTTPTPAPTPPKKQETNTTPKPSSNQPTPSSEPTPTPVKPSESVPWPSSNTLDPIVAELPKEVETDYKAVARYLSSKATDDFHKVKLLHDYVADRVAYDVPNYRAGNYPPFDPETVFRTRLAVCAGYAKLFQAMADEVGVESVYVVGDASGGESHAWNAVKLDGLWYLLDVTWDSGSVNGDSFEKKYRSDFLFTPPDIFVLRHFPDDPAWQLLEAPIDRGTFLRKPQLDPDFFAQGFTLLTPDRSQVTVDRSLTIKVKNTKEMFMLANYSPKEGGNSTKCDVKNGEIVEITCDFPAVGEYEVIVFSSTEKYSTYYSIGKFQVNRE
jgi:hypothetical protein